MIQWHWKLHEGGWMHILDINDTTDDTTEHTFSWTDKTGCLVEQYVMSREATDQEIKENKFKLTVIT